MSSLCCWVWELRLLHVTPPSCDSPCLQTLKNLYDRPQPLLQAEHVIIPRHFHNKVCGWGNKKIWVSGRQNEKIGEGRECHETTTNFSLLLPLCFLLCSVPFSSGHLSFNSLFSLLSSCHLQMNSMNSVSSSEDIKPPPGLQNLGNINYQCTSPGGMSKHICAICGDRSSGNVSMQGRRRGMGKHIYTPTHHHNSPHPDENR